MFRSKRFVALMLVCVMALSMVACGSDEKKGKTKVDVSKVKTIYDALKLAPEYTQGEYTTEMKMVASMGDQEMSMKLNASGQKNGEDGTASMGFSIEANGADISMDFDDVVVAAGGKAYIDIDSVVKSISDVDSEFGSIGIKMPKADEKKQQAVTDKAMDFVAGMLESAFEDIDIKEKNGTFTATLKDAEDYKGAAIGILEYVDKNKDDITDILKDSAEVYDVQEWLVDVIDDMEEDIIDAAKKVGLPITEDQIDEVKDAIKDVEIDDVTGDLDEVMDEIDLSEVIDMLKDVDDDEFAEAFEELDKCECSISVTAEEDKFVCEYSFAIEAEGAKIEMSMKSEFDCKDVTIKAPKNATTISDMIDYAMDNQDVFMDIAAGAQELGQKFQKAAAQMGNLDVNIGGLVPDTDAPETTDEPDPVITEEPEPTEEPEEGELSVEYGDGIAYIEYAGNEYEIEFDSDVFEPIELDQIVALTTEDQTGVVEFIFDNTLDYDTYATTYKSVYADQILETKINGYNALVINYSDSQIIGLIDVDTEDGEVVSFAVEAGDYDALELLSSAILSFENDN